MTLDKNSSNNKKNKTKHHEILKNQNVCNKCESNKIQPCIQEYSKMNEKK